MPVTNGVLVIANDAISVITYENFHLFIHAKFPAKIDPEDGPSDRASQGEWIRHSGYGRGLGHGEIVG
jgi:hypothetical protein